ncbi:unnamed protein product, partial [Penicillium nalgiovense]
FTMSSAYEASMYRKGESSDAQTSWLSLFLIDLLKLLICAARLSAPASHKPITTKLRTTIRHLRARAGFWSPFRGFEISLISSFTLACLLSFTRACSSSILVEIVAQFCIGMLLAPWKMLLVHLVISEPSPKCFYQRIPGYRAWIKIAPAAAFQEIPISAYKLLQRAIETVNWCNLDSFLDLLIGTGSSSAIRVLIPPVVVYLAVIVTRAIFIRVAASMLPEEDKPIIPFDRSFGGKLKPSIRGSNGCLTLSDAWVTFDWPSRIRFTKFMFTSEGIALALQGAVTLVCLSSDACTALPKV